MPVAGLTTDALLARIKARAQMPTADGRLSDAEVFAMVSDVLETSLTRSIYDADDGRWVTTAPDVSIVAGVSDYAIPDRAWAEGVEAVHIVDAQGNEAPADYVDRADAWQFRGAPWSQPAFTLVDNSIRLLPTPTDNSYKLRVRYLQQLPQLVAVSACAAVTAVTANRLTASYTGAGWSAGATSRDVVNGSTGRVRVLDESVILSSGTNVDNLDGGWVTDGVAVGDYVCVPGETCVVPIPRVAIHYAVELSARQLCIALGDVEMLQSFAATTEAARQDMERGIAERSRTRPVVINRHSPLRSGGMGRRGRWVR